MKRGGSWRTRCGCIMRSAAVQKVPEFEVLEFVKPCPAHVPHVRTERRRRSTAPAGVADLRGYNRPRGLDPRMPGTLDRCAHNRERSYRAAKYADDGEAGQAALREVRT